MVVSPGDKLLVITRRLFDGDLRRHFVGEVEEWSGAVARVRGYAFIFDQKTNEFERREDLRWRLFPLIDAGLVVMMIPKEIVLTDLRYETRDGKRWLTDGKLFRVNITEFTSGR